MVAVDLTAADVSIHVEPGDDVDLDVTVPAGWQAGTWTAAVYTSPALGTALVTATVTVAGQVVSVAIDGDTLANLIPQGGTKFTGWWRMRRTSGDTRTWLGGPLIIGPGQTVRNGTQALTVLVDGADVTVTASTGVTLADVTEAIAAIDVAQVLDDLTDVDVSAPADGDVLGYDGDTETWGPVEVEAAGAVTAHAAATDPHGDRAYTDSEIAGLGDLAALDEVADAQVATTAAIALTKLASIATARLLGNNTGSSGAPVALTAAEAKTLLAIVIGDVSGLQAALDGKLDLGGGGRITGTVDVQSDEENAAYSFDTADGATYFSVAGGPMHVTTWTEWDPVTGKGGTERYMARWRTDSHTLELGNRVEINTNPNGTGTTRHFFDAFAGYAGVGSKHYLTNIMFVGRMAGTGPPTSPDSEQWDAGDVVLDGDGNWWVCTVTGTPGTWVSTTSP